MMARAAVGDVARALGYPYSLGDTIAKLIPFGKQGFPVSIAGSLDEVPELAQVYKSDASAREVLDLAQYDMHAVESAGLLKFDFLGLTNLSVLADSVARVCERLKEEVELDLLPLNAQKTYEMLARGETHGVFQLASGGMTNYLVELKPSSIHDINAMVALYRPG